MADGFDTSRLERRISEVATSVYRIESQLDTANGRLGEVTQELNETARELQELKDSFEQFMQDTVKATVLQKAATELVRVRQEIENKFGSYKVVRETMLGVLQATDLALVKKTTISQVTEELMLSTPDYWLAPCLVAISAWIGNDRDLANRAIAEAVKRDEEKTALTMALICRRNNRTATCYEWLSIYFSRQNANHFTESNFTYLNAYLNGVFGPDEKHMCDDYVAKWMEELQSTAEDTKEKQVEQWKEYCSNFTVDLESQFPAMSSCVHEYDDIVAYVSRIGSVDTIAGTFSKMKNIEVDQQKLKKNIDQTLIDLISRYDTREEPLRKEERYLHAVRHFDGDKEAAKLAILEADRAKRENAIDLISQMTNIIVKKDHVSPSEKKTSVSFLSPYIQDGFKEYITEKKETFPSEITLEIDGWTGKTSDGSNAAALKQSYEEEMLRKKEQEAASLSRNKPKQLKTLAIVLAVLGLVGCFMTPLYLAVGLVAAAFLWFRSKQEASNLIITADTIDERYNKKISDGKKQISDAIAEWTHTQKQVEKFESGKMPDIVA